ncbi:MAG: TraX family protein [Leptolyngbya sp. IPPAS B-1204]|nr:MAG: TraX family protein [Leptolyngbya sp. IPPAS B-1204]
MPQLLTNYHIKLLAALLMLIDHVGAILLPELTLLRVIGRLSFPLFAWLLVQGEAHTRSVHKYALRLLGLGLISQPIYMAAFQVSRPNILFTLLLGLICLRLVRAFPRWQLAIWVGGGLIATAAHLEYGSYGIAVIALIRYFKLHWLWLAAWIGLHLLISVVSPDSSSQIWAVSTALLMGMTNQQRGAKARWFYWFYPLHLLILVLIRSAVQQGFLELNF